MISFQVQHNYDTVVIGSGVSGMTAGIILAKTGRSVLILEQDKKPGGLMQTFVRGSNIFPTGIHKLGSLGPGEILRHYLKFLGVFDRLSLVPMDESGYEKFIFPDSSFTSPGKYNALLNALVKAFPLEEKAVNAYLDTMKKTVEKFPLYSLTRNPSDSALEIEFSLSIYSLLFSLGCSEGLIKVLTANKLLHGMEPKECPAIVHFLLTDSFLNSSWRVDEAKASLAGAFTHAFDELGGSLRCSAMVSRINCDSKDVKGIKLATGEEIACKEVVFTGHPQSMIKLCPENTFRPAFKNRILRAENTVGIFGFAAKWMDNSSPFALRDIYIYPSHNPDCKSFNGSFDGFADKAAKEDCHGAFPGRPLDHIYISGMPTKQDKAFSITALSAISEAETRRLIALKKEGSDGYLKAKEAMAESMVKVIIDRFGFDRRKIEIAATYTPLTFNRYTLTPLGTAYGIKKSAETFWKNQFNPVTRVQGLFLAGQSLTMSGFLGALLSSVQACLAMEGMGSLAKAIADFKENDNHNNLNQDVF